MIHCAVTHLAVRLEVNHVMGEVGGGSRTEPHLDLAPPTHSETQVQVYIGEKQDTGEQERVQNKCPCYILVWNLLASSDGSKHQPANKRQENFMLGQ